MRKIHSSAVLKADVDIYPYLTYGLFQTIAHPVYYFLWTSFDKQTYESPFIRMLSVLLSIPLIFNKYFSGKAKKALPFYWYFVCLYSLPFFFTFMLLKNNFSYAWSLNSFTGVVLCILFLDIRSLSILMPVGVFIGWLAYHLTTPYPYYDFNAIKTVCITYGSAFIFGGLFAQCTRNITREKLRTMDMKMLAGSIAHELRTPLSAIMMDANFLVRFFPCYQDAYAKAREAQLPIHKLAPHEEKGMAALPENLQTLSRNAHTMITMLLTNLNEKASSQRVEVCSMKTCVTEALMTYPFSAHERKLVHWEEGTADFLFLGHKEFMKHVLYNLLKNALYAIAAAGKGEIFIEIAPASASHGQKKNRLVFKDTGLGISPANLGYIFERFYTSTEHGSGIGLAFCQSVIQGFRGEMACTSREGEHVTFIISLPALGVDGWMKRGRLYTFFKNITRARGQVAGSQSTPEAARGLR